MKPVTSARKAEIRSRQASVTDVRNALRELRIQLALLNYRVGSEIGLRDIDLDCLDLIDVYGSLSPSELARRAGVHPATMTGILDRLEQGGWIVRERDPADRRAVVVTLVRDRYGELVGMYQGMSRSMNKLLSEYSDEELRVIAGFLRRSVDAGRNATEEIAAD